MKRLGTFLILVVLFSGPFWYLAREIGFFLYTMMLMWSPALAALVVCRFIPLAGRDLGLSRFQWRETLRAHLTISATILVVFLMLYGSGVAHFPDPVQFKDRAEAAGMTGWPLPAFAICFFLLTASAGIVSLTASALGEEIGWRGFLVPELYRKFGFTWAALLSGLIWSLWHFPLLLGRAQPLELANFTITLTGLSFFWCWFRLKSDSVWPAAVAHGAYNALLGNYFMRLTLVPEPGNSVWMDDSGYGMAIAAVIVAIIFWALRKQAETAWAASSLPQANGKKERTAPS